MLVQRDDGAYLKCCTGHGYWSLMQPLPRDERFHPVRRIYDGWVCYESSKPRESLVSVRRREVDAAAKVARLWQ